MLQLNDPSLNFLMEGNKNSVKYVIKIWNEIEISRLGILMASMLILKLIIESERENKRLMINDKANESKLCKTVKKGKSG